MRLLLDFSSVAQGGARSYALGFLGALAALGPPESAHLTVLVPHGAPEFESLVQALVERPIDVHSVTSGQPGTWGGRARSQLVMSWSYRRSVDQIYIPRETAPLLLSGRFSVLARSRHVWSRPRGARLPTTARWILRHMTGRAAVRRAEVVLVPSATFGADLPVPITKRRVVHHGCDLPVDRHVRVGPPTPGRPLKIVSLGAVTPHKRLDRVIASVAALRRLGTPVHLELWGHTPDGAETRRLREAARVTLDEDPIRGTLASSDRTAMLHKADVLALGSSFESFGMAMIEAQRTSTVVWAPRCALVDELCGSNAVTFQEGDTEEAAQAIKVSIPSLTDLAAAGVERSLEFTWQRCVRETLMHLGAPYPNSGAASPVSTTTV